MRGLGLPQNAPIRSARVEVWKHEAVEEFGAGTRFQGVEALTEAALSV